MTKMKNIIRFVLSVLCLLSCVSAQAVRFPDEAIRNCQLVDSVARTVTIIFSPDKMPLCSFDSLHIYTLQDQLLFADSIATVSLYGPMTDYAYRQPKYYLDQRSEDGCYYHTFTYEEVERPGNSGQPEFTFIVDYIDDIDSHFIWPDTLGEYAIDRRLMFYNGTPCVMLIMPGGLPYLSTDKDELYQRSLIASEIRPLSDYNFADSVDQYRIANFRSLPGMTGMYRSYHPFYPSMYRETEEMRLYWVGELGARLGIQSDICLTGNLEAQAGQYYHYEEDSFLIAIPPFYQSIIDNHHVCYVGGGGGLSVAECYYRTESPLLAQWFAEMVRFINDTTNPMPMLMHCAIGADRTGMFCAILESLCGQDWPTIVSDYMATGNMLVQTYRHPNRLRYGMIRMTGLDPATCTSAQLTAAIRHHLVETRGVLTHAEIDQMLNRLNASTTALEGVNADTQHTCYDLLGRPVAPDATGVIITGGTKRLVVR